MTSRKGGSGPTSAALEHDNPAGVAAYLGALDHPLKPVVEATRAAVLGADPAITEGVKWNSASFYRCGWFATINLRPKGGVQVVFHHGAKVRADAGLRRSLDDPSGLLTWLSADRAVVSLAGPDDFAGKRAAFVELVRQWVAYQVRLAAAAEPSAATDRGRT